MTTYGVLGFYLLVAVVVSWVNGDGRFASGRVSFARGALWPAFLVYTMLEGLFEDSRRNA